MATRVCSLDVTGLTEVAFYGAYDGVRRRAVTVAVLHTLMIVHHVELFVAPGLLHLVSGRERDLHGLQRRFVVV